MLLCLRSLWHRCIHIRYGACRVSRRYRLVDTDSHSWLWQSLSDTIGIDGHIFLEDVTCLYTMTVKYESTKFPI